MASAQKVPVTNRSLCTTGGEYIDPETLDMFEEETGIDIVYEEYETNEIMYPKIQSGAIALRCRMPVRLHDPAYD